MIFFILCTHVVDKKIKISAKKHSDCFPHSRKQSLLNLCLYLLLSLTLQLRELEKDGLVSRTIYPVVPPKIEYQLTDIGHSMKDIILAMYDWGLDYQKMQAKKTPFSKEV
ncbi:hypothetical protein B2I21_13015 [Chryseobacterium mucoviscidosis]|nr:hypothetical protein B2I21_13015 [Chryseobacterium mucoviscidosis]